MGDPDQEHARRQLRVAMRETGLELTQLAREARVAHTTLTRFMNDPAVKHAPSARTMNKVAAAVARIRMAREAAASIEPPTVLPKRPPRASSPKRGV